jgi:hypothetical protein
MTTEKEIKIFAKNIINLLEYMEENDISKFLIL